MEWSINMIFYSKEFFSSGLMLMLLRKIASFQPSCDIVRQLSSTELNKMLLSRFVYNATSSSLVWTITVQFIPLDLDWSLFTIFFHFNNDSNWSFGLFWRHLSAQFFGQEPWKLYCLLLFVADFPLSHLYLDLLSE